jgi:hypothetical protein
VAVPFDIQGKKYGPVGECIYCGSDGGSDGLRSEHIMPYSLGGNAELLAASCKDCEAITSYLDGYLGRSIYYHLRVHANTQTRSKYPDLLPVEVETSTGKDQLLVPSQDQPFFLKMPFWAPPGVLRGISPSPQFAAEQLKVYWSVPPGFRHSIGIPDDEEIRVNDTATRPVNYPTFARAIAKIAYAHAVAHMGLLGFRPLVLPDIILGRYPMIPYFVGCDPEILPPTTRGVMHFFEFVDIAYEKIRLIAVKLRIFAHSGVLSQNIGMPTYIVVIGAPKLTKRDA